ncbi:MAG: DMT family transporter [Chloroflexi bacterium]|nr:DMT family transporter [Chloroflexota bacterium]
MSENPIGLSDSASTKLDSAVRNSQSAIRGYLLVALAASIWGTIGFFFRALHDEFGFAESTIAFLRPAVAAAILLPALALFQPRLLKISWRALPFFIAYGFGAALYNIFYTQAVVQTGVTTAAILLYTAPAFVSLIAWRAWNEPLDARKISAIILAFGGCVLVVRGYDLTQLRLNAAGVAFGVGAGLLYGVYSLFNLIGA